MRHPGSPRNVATALRIGLSVACLSCSGSIDDSSNVTTPGVGTHDPGAGAAGTGAGNSSAGNGSGAGGQGSAPVSVCDGALPAARAVLLTPRQYVTALRDLLGESAVSDEDVATAGEIEIEVVDRPWMTTATLDQRVRLAEQAAESLRGRTATFLGCTALTDRACVRTGLERLGLRAYKRPLDAQELDDVMELYDTGLAAITDDAGESATLLALQGILAAPSTLYRTEFTGDAAGALSAYERAAALAILLLDSLPDDDLLAAAADGSLMSEAGVQVQIDRLLALPRVRDHLTEVVLSAYKAPKVFETPKDEELFPDYTPALQFSMYEETRRFVDDVLWTRDADLNELLTSRHSFVDAALAEVYGLPRPAGAADAFSAVELPPSRAGLLTQASVLSVLSRTDKTSVVARGLFVRGALLCLPKVSSPPDSVQAQVAMQLDADATQPELAEYRATTSPCNGCHSQFDRFGLLLEGFDPIGRARTTPVPAQDFTGLPPFDGVIADPAALAQYAAQDGRFVACLARRTLAYALTEAYQPSASCGDDPLDEAITSRGAGMRALVAAIVNQPAFALRVEEP